MHVATRDVASGQAYTDTKTLNNCEINQAESLSDPLKITHTAESTQMQMGIPPRPNHKGNGEGRTFAVERSCCCLQCHTALPMVRAPHWEKA
jgi:hypothetical protein